MIDRIQIIFPHQRVLSNPAKTLTFKRFMNIKTSEDVINIYTLSKAKGSFLIYRMMLQEGSLTPFTKPH